MFQIMHNSYEQCFLALIDEIHKSPTCAWFQSITFSQKTKAGGCKHWAKEVILFNWGIGHAYLSYLIIQDENVCRSLCSPTSPQDNWYRVSWKSSEASCWFYNQKIFTIVGNKLLSMFLYSQSAGTDSAHPVHDQSVCPAVEHCLAAWSAWVRKKLQVLNCVWKRRRWRASVRVYWYVSSLLCAKEASSRTLGCVATKPSISFGGAQVEMITEWVAASASVWPEDTREEAGVAFIS